MTFSRHARTTRPALVLAALLALLAPAAAAAAARPARAGQLRAAHAIERYYASYGSPTPIPPPVAAVAPVSRRAAARPATAPLTRGGPGWDAAVGAGALLVVIAAGLGVLAGRDSMRPRRT
jgi:hypothetical protein